MTKMPKSVKMALKNAINKADDAVANSCILFGKQYENAIHSGHGKITVACGGTRVQYLDPEGAAYTYLQTAVLLKKLKK